MTSEQVLAAWLRERVDVLDDPVTVRRIGAGQSNVTSLITDGADRTWVLRQPPPGSLAATAHDTGREARVIAALRDTDVPVPEVVGTGELDGRPFFVMTYAPGDVLSDERRATTLPTDEKLALSDDIPRVLATLHAVVPAATGLGDLGPTDGYIGRQLRRLSDNWRLWTDDGAPEKAWTDMQRRLADGRPRQQRSSLTHGDFRLSNVMVDCGAVTAVLDWELCTIGDPLADLGWLLDDWRGPSEPAIAIPSPTRVGGFRDREHIVARYAELSGLDLSALDYYRAFSHWRAAGLLQGVLHRMRAGVVGGDAPSTGQLADTVRRLLDEALELLPARPRATAATGPPPSD